MSILAAAGLIAVGLALLAAGGELLVRGGATIAKLARVTPAVIGLTIVAMGTSLPEMAVTFFARLSGRPEVAMGNIIGSNIFNIAAILGLASMFIVLRVHGNAVKLEWPFMFISSALALLLARDGRIDRLEGGFFVVSLVLFTVYCVHVARNEVRGKEAEAIKEEIEALTTSVRKDGGIAFNIGLVVGGIVALVLGARFLVDGAVTVAVIAGMSERVIGLTIVAAGTGLPELATSVVAALRKQTEIAVANVMGSNIFNILGTVGLVSLIEPTEVSPALVNVDMWWMMAFSLAVLPMMYTGRRIVRTEGALLLAGYAVYLWILIENNA
ncbi:MAG: calcium/sodium antiporter [Deltaproteobacteria bacterium]|nr:calcium/sodium antiporter [Deltaproteobacteria bacterium]